MATVNGGYQNNASAQQSLAPAKYVNAQSFLKRFESKLMSLMMSGDPGISAFPKEDNIMIWKGTIHGSKDIVSFVTWKQRYCVHKATCIWITSSYLLSFVFTLFSLNCHMMLAFIFPGENSASCLFDSCPSMSLKPLNS